MPSYMIREDYVPSLKDTEDAWKMHHTEEIIRPFSCVDSFCDVYNLKKEQVNVTLLNSLIGMRSDDCVEQLDEEIRPFLKNLKKDVCKYMFLLPYTNKIRLVNMTEVERKLIETQIKDVSVSIKSTYDGKSVMDIHSHPLIAEEVVGNTMVFFANKNGMFFFLGLRHVQYSSLKCLKESLLLKTLDS